jgi:hypothetical protein
LTQQPSSHVFSPARKKAVVENPVLDNPNTQIQFSAGTSLQSHKDRYVQWGSCVCPKEFLEIVEPPNCGVQIVSCPICQKEKEKIYI